MKLFYLSLFLLGFSISSNAQLADGTTAPDFTLSDLDGNSHNLYTYLNEGKTVFIKIFACHCPPCWAYHQTGKLDSLYTTYGPDGTDQIMVLMLEHDEYNSDAFSGQGGYTQGDWITGNSVPMCDVEWPDRGVFDDYNIIGYPRIMMVCPDKLIKNLSTSLTVGELYQEADDCPGTLNIDKPIKTASVSLDQINKQLTIQGFQKITNISVFNLSGQQVLNNQSLTSTVDLSSLNSGMYLLQIEHAKGAYREKIVLQ
jgi:thiol-disulfide isomerase/thioredoxin